MPTINFSPRVAEVVGTVCQRGPAEAARRHFITAHTIERYLGVAYRWAGIPADSSKLKIGRLCYRIGLREGRRRG